MIILNLEPTDPFRLLIAETLCAALGRELLRSRAGSATRPPAQDTGIEEKPRARLRPHPGAGDYRQGTEGLL